jgi:signal transduction histidine kinase
VKSKNLMKHKRNGLARQYQAALRKHLDQGPRASLRPAQGLGLKAMTIGLETLDLAGIHEEALIIAVLPGDSAPKRAALARQAGHFFARAITPLEQVHRTAVETRAQLEQLNRTLRERGAALAASNERLEQEIAQRKAAEQSLRKSEQHYAQLLAQSRQMQEQLRLLSHQLLLAQEEERRRISRELHDVIAQTLTGINVRLATLKKEARLSTKGIERNIARTQRLVERSVGIVHKFARELRPSVLDDLGLIPALRTFMNTFQEETGVRVSLSAYGEVERVSGDQRTVLYRVAQEALTNVARHAQASRVAVRIQQLDGAVCMNIRDNGKGFHHERVLHPKKIKRLGLLGMRERLEMVGGHLTIESSADQGTTLRAQIPLAHPARAAGGGKLAEGVRQGTTLRL